jgi:hypothetical protein
MGTGTDLPVLVDEVGSKVLDVKPPSPRLEMRPEQPGDDHVWQAGYWKWSGSEYVWVAGRWVKGPSTRALWISGYWRRESDGWVWQSGSWKR